VTRAELRAVAVLLAVVAALMVFAWESGCWSGYLWAGC